MTQFVHLISAEAWARLTGKEQLVFLAVDDHALGKYDMAELDRRLAGIRELPERKREAVL